MDHLKGRTRQSHSEKRKGVARVKEHQEVSLAAVEINCKCMWLVCMVKRPNVMFCCTLLFCSFACWFIRLCCDVLVSIYTVFMPSKWKKEKQKKSESDTFTILSSSADTRMTWPALPSKLPHSLPNRTPQPRFPSIHPKPNFSSTFFHHHRS